MAPSIVELHYLQKAVKCPLIRARCPESTKGCPCWHEMYMENIQTGEGRVTKDCLFRLLPGLLVVNMQNANAAQAAVEVTRNEVAGGLKTLAAVLSKMHPEKITHDG